MPRQHRRDPLMRTLARLLTTDSKAEFTAIRDLLNRAGKWRDPVEDVCFGEIVYLD